MAADKSQPQVVLTIDVAMLIDAFKEKFPKAYAMGIALGVLKFETHHRGPPCLHLEDGRVVKGWFAIEKHLNPLEEILGGNSSNSTLLSWLNNVAVYDNCSIA